MPQVVLVNPKIGKNRHAAPANEAVREPLGILALSSYLEQNGYSVQLLDAILYEEDRVRDELASLVHREDKLLLIGFSVMTAQISHALEMADFIRTLDASLPLLWGGVHPTLFAEETSEDPAVDMVVHGRGEIPLLEVCNSLQAHGALPSDIPGTCTAGTLIPAVQIPKDFEYPPLRYDLLDLPHYLGPLPHYLLSEKPNLALQVISSRGCPWRCAFCINNVTKNRWTAYSAGRFLDELTALKDTYALDSFRLLDEDFFCSKKRTFDILEGMKQRQINLVWGANIRANYFRDNYITEEVAKEMKSLGCKFLSFGAESGNQRVLDFIRKDITVEQILRSAEVCHAAGIVPIYSWMIGIPTQTHQEIADTLKVMIRTSQLCSSAIHYRLWIFRPFPGSCLYDICLEHGLYQPTSVRDWIRVGADEDSNTGFYSLDNLKWIQDKRFIHFTGKYGHQLPGWMLSDKVLTRLLARLILFFIDHWNNPVIQGLYGIFKGLMMVRRLVLKLAGKR